MRVSFETITANAWASRFLRHLAVEARAAVSDPRGLVAKTAGAAQRIFDARCESLPDKQARMILGSCAVVLAAYRELRARGLDAETAYEIVRHAFLRTFQKPAKLIWGVVLGLSRDPVKLFSRRIFRGGGQGMYGSSMEFASEVTADSVELIVNRCAFHQFFVDNGEPQLTPIFCGWDRNWMDVVDGSDRPVHSERPTTISTGSDQCRFRLVRDDSGQAKTTRDVIVELTNARGSSNSPIINVGK